MIGRVINNTYRIYDRVGAGGFATVYLGRNVRSNELVAIKVLKTEYTDDPAFVERFRREAELAHKMRHPNVVQVLDYGVEHGIHYLVMEYVQGKTLAAIIRERGSLAIAEALAITAQVCAALDAAYRAGVVHRDIKPQNVMVTPTGVVKVMDLGIAHMGALSTLTQSGMLIGTPHYLSPEVARGGKADIRSDLYALGIVLYEMLTGHVPFHADSPWALMRHQIETPPPPVELRRKEIPAWLSSLVARALAKDPAQRFQTPHEMLAALGQQAMAPADVRALTHTPPPRPARVRGRTARRQRTGSASRPQQLLALAGLVALLLLGAMAALMAGAGERSITANGHGVETDPAAQTAPRGVVTQSQQDATGQPTAPPAMRTETPTPRREGRDHTPTGTATVDAIATRTVTPTATRTRRATAQVTPATSTPTRTATPAKPTTEPGVIADFEVFGTWKRGDEANGTFVQSMVQTYRGNYAARLDYHFGTPANDYVVFMQAHALAGQPRRITAWVYGDGAGHLLNVWIKDQAGQVWQVPLGAVKDSGWQQMAGAIDVDQPWPWTHISGPDNQAVDYPVSFYGLVLDDVPDNATGTGTLYIDELRADDEAMDPTAAPTAPPGPTSPPAGGPTATPAATAPAAAPAAPVIEFWADQTSIAQGGSTTLRWHVENVREVYLDGDSVTGPDGSRTVQPAQTTTYELRVVYAGGEERRNVTIDVSLGGGTLSVTGDGAEDQSIAGSGLTQNTIVVGDEVDDAWGAEEPWRGWLSFDFSSMPDGATIGSVELKFFVVSMEGDPFHKLGALQLKHVETDRVSRYSAPDTGSLSLWSVPGGGHWYTVKDPALTGWVQSRLDSGQRRVEFRLQFSVDRHLDGITDAIVIESGENWSGSGNVPQLTIAYRP